MPRMYLADAESLTPEQAAEVVRILDLESRWETRTGSGSNGTDPVALHAKQKAYDQFSEASERYVKTYPPGKLPEVAAGRANRAWMWLRIIREILLRADRAGMQMTPTYLMAKAHRLAMRVAVQMKIDSLEAAPVFDDSYTSHSCCLSRKCYRATTAFSSTSRSPDSLSDLILRTNNDRLGTFHSVHAGIHQRSSYHPTPLANAVL